MTPDPRPPLDDLLAHPERAVGLTPPDARALLAQLAGLLPVLIAAQFGESRAADAASPAKELPLQCLKAKDVAALTGLEEAYIHAMCRTGKLPAFKTGKYWLIPAGRFREWQQQGGLDGVPAPRLPSPHAARGRIEPPRMPRGRPARRGPRAPRLRPPGSSTQATPSRDSAWSRPPRVAVRRTASGDRAEPTRSVEERQ